MTARRGVKEAAYPGGGDVLAAGKSPGSLSSTYSGWKDEQFEVNAILISLTPAPPPPPRAPSPDSLARAESGSLSSVDDIIRSESPPPGQSASSCWVAKLIGSAATVATKPLAVTLLRALYVNLVKVWRVFASLIKYYLFIYIYYVEISRILRPLRWFHIVKLNNKQFHRLKVYNIRLFMLKTIKY